MSTQSPRYSIMAADIYNWASPSTYTILRFAGPVPPPGSPLLFNADHTAPGGAVEMVAFKDRQFMVVADPFQRTPLRPNDLQELRKKMQENATFDDLIEWAHTLNDRFVLNIMRSAKEVNNKSAISRQLIPCKRALFMGIVTPHQPPPSRYANVGLNHARVVVDGAIPMVSEGMVNEFSIRVGDTVVGRIVGTTAILSRVGCTVSL